MKVFAVAYSNKTDSKDSLFGITITTYLTTVEAASQEEAIGKIVMREDDPPNNAQGILCVEITETLARKVLGIPEPEEPPKPSKPKRVLGRRIVDAP